MHAFHTISCNFCCLCNIHDRVMSSLVHLYVIVEMSSDGFWSIYGYFLYRFTMHAYLSDFFLLPWQSYRKALGYDSYLSSSEVWICLSHAYTWVVSDRLLSFVGITRTTMITSKYVDHTSQYTRSPLWKKILPSGYRYDPLASTFRVL